LCRYVEAVIGGDADAGAAAAAVRGRCKGDADGGGDGGLEWDGASGYLYLTVGLCTLNQVDP
jgi:hypothetical protein